MDHTDFGEDQRMGNQDNVTSIPLQNNQETWVKYHTRTCNMARKIWIQMGLPFLYERIEESMWRAMRWAWDEKSNAVSDSFKDNGKSGCGVVIKCVDRERWVTRGKIAVPLQAGTAMGAEFTGLWMITGKSVNQCINKILNK